MAISLVGVGGIFTRLGLLFEGIRSANEYSGTDDLKAGGLRSLGALYPLLTAQFQSTLTQDLDGTYAAIQDQRSSLSSIKQALARLAQTVLIDQVDLDATLTDKSLTGALNELIRQMKGSGSIYSPDSDVDASVSAASIAAVSTNTGTGKVICSVVRPDGRNHELILAEVMEAVVTADAASGATARSENLTVKGERPNATGDILGWDWPGGSGISVALTATDASVDAGLNLLTNSDMEDFTANVPDSFHILVGVAGTDILKESSTVLRSGNALRFQGQASPVLSSIAQEFDADTTADLQPDTVYAVGFWAKLSASVSAGVVAVSLVDSSNAIVADDASTNNTVSVAYGSLSSSDWTFVSGFFRTAKTFVPGTTVRKLKVHVTTAITSGESIYIDDLAMTPAVDAYGNGQGPWLAAFAGATNFLRGDQFNVTLTNTRSGTIQEFFDRVYGMRALGLQLPSDTGGTETIVDTLAYRSAATFNASDIMVRGLMAPASRHSTTGNTGSTSVDFTLFNKALFLLAVGVTDDSVDAKVQEDDDAAFGTPTDVSGKAITAAAVTDDNHVWVIQVQASEMTKRYARLLVTVNAEGAAALTCAIALGLDPVLGSGQVSQAAIVDEVVA